MPRESMHYDVVIVAAAGGPRRGDPPEAALRCALRMRARERLRDRRAHPFRRRDGSPRARELFPDWKKQGAPLNTPVSEDRFLFLTESGSFRTPDFLLPACFKNYGNYVISLGNLTRWLGRQAEGLGLKSFPALPRRKSSTKATRKGRRHRRFRHQPRRREDRSLPARDGAARKIHFLRRGLARTSGQAAVREVPPAAEADPQVYASG